jgi:excisionase family DNA binding protein
MLTARELAELLQVHTSTIYRLVRKNKIPGFRLGSDWRFARTAIEKWMEAENPLNNDFKRS